MAVECNRQGGKRIGMMCSDGLRKIGLYDKYFTAANAKMKLVYPSEEMQKLVTLGICNAKNIKRNDPNSDEYPKKLYTKVCDWFLEAGVDCIVGGCTDISAVFSPQEWHGVNYVDSLKVLANIVCNHERK